jgi:hypothetical protein
MKKIVKLVLAALVLTASSVGISAVGSMNAANKSAAVMVASSYDEGDTGGWKPPEDSLQKEHGQGCRRCDGL